MSSSAFLKQKKQQFHTPGFVPVNFVNSVELEILQVGETAKLTVIWQTANLHALYEAKKNGNATEV
jgi:hypothetical protein